MRGALFKRLGYQYSCDRKYLAKARISVSFVCHIHGVRYSLFVVDKTNGLGEADVHCFDSNKIKEIFTKKECPQ